MFGGNALDVRTCQNCSAYFKSEDIDLSNKDCSERPTEVNNSVLEELLEEDPRQSTKDLDIQLNCTSNTILN